MKVTVLRHFYTVSFKLSVKNKTSKSQRVRDKTYKVVNLISGRASIKSMDISTAWPKSHIHTWIYPYIHGYIHGFIHGYPYPRQAWKLNEEKTQIIWLGTRQQRQQLDKITVQSLTLPNAHLRSTTLAFYTGQSVDNGRSRCCTQPILLLLHAPASVDKASTDA